jgi:hypothetical protein
MSKQNRASEAPKLTINVTYEFKAKQNMWAIEQIRDFLIIKGQIKPSKTDQERLEKEVGEVVAA